MTNPLKYAVRLLALRRFRSDAVQGILPLSSVRSAAVFIDAGLPAAEEAELAVKEFFGSRNIGLLVLRPVKGQLNYAGFMRKRFRLPDGQSRSEDLFVCLSDDPQNFAAEFESLCSPAGFKIGRMQIRGGIFDLVMSHPSGRKLDQRAAFDAIADFLLKIK